MGEEVGATESSQRSVVDLTEESMMRGEIYVQSKKGTRVATGVAWFGRQCLDGIL